MRRVSAGFELKNKTAFGGNTPEEQIRTNLFLNLLSAIVSFVLAVALYVTYWNRADALFIIYIVAGFLLAMSGWQISTFIVGLKLKKNFDKRKTPLENGEENLKEINTFEPAKTRELLNEPNLDHAVPPSVTEKTTGHLAKKKKENYLNPSSSLTDRSETFRLALARQSLKGCNSSSLKFSFFILATCVLSKARFVKARCG